MAIETGLGGPISPAFSVVAIHSVVETDAITLDLRGRLERRWR
jgi:hypothetical protein